MAKSHLKRCHFLACFSLFIALIYPLAALAQPCDPPVATAVSVQGTVEVQKGGGYRMAGRQV